MNAEGTSGLFRHEAVAAHHNRLDGEVVLNQTFSSRFVTAAIVLATLAAMLWVVFGHYSRVETVRGILTPLDGYAKIMPTHPGVVSSLGVHEGDRVKAGDKLAIIATDARNASGGSVSRAEIGSIDNQAGLAKTQLGLAEQRAKSEVARLRASMEGLQKQSISIDEQIGLQQRVVASIASSFEAVKPIVQKGYISQAEYERRRQTLLSAQEDLSRLQQQYYATLAEIVKTRKELTQAALTGKNDQTNARATLETLRQQRIRLTGDESYAVGSPVSGRVTMVQAGIGRAVDGTTPLMMILPEGGVLHCELFVPSRAIGFVRKGQEVRLLYDAYPYQRFGSHVGHVESISSVAASASETGAPFKFDEPVYRVTVAIEHQEITAYSERHTLQAGMTVVASLVLERQSFLSWMLEPLRAVSRRN